jgi:hypothetical protein
MEQLAEWELAGETEGMGLNPPSSAILPTSNLTWPVLVLDPAAALDGNWYVVINQDHIPFNLFSWGGVFSAVDFSSFYELHFYQ